MENFPRMLYKGGTDLQDYRIIDDESGYARAEADGYFDFGEAKIEAPKRQKRAAPQAD